VSCRILAGFLAVLLMMVAGAAEPTRVVQAEEILKKIELGEPVEYDNVTVVGDLNLSGPYLSWPYPTSVPVERNGIEKNLGLPDWELIVGSLSITNSIIFGSVNLNSTLLDSDFSGTRFNGPVFMIGSRFGWIDFSGAQFNGTADFRSAQFNGITDFRSAQFNQDADFGGVKFNQDADFRDTQFNGTARFGNVHFNQDADFLGVQFNQDADFRDTQFNGTARFRNVHFNQDASFMSVRFNQEASFRKTQFNQTADFFEVDFKQNASLENSVFNQTVFFIDAEFNQTADFSKAKFNQSAYFNLAQFNHTANYANSEFSKVADFSSYHPVIEMGDRFLVFGSIRSRTRFKGSASFNMAEFNQSVLFKDVSFIDLSLDYGNFARDMTFDGAQINGTLSLYRTKYDSLNIRWSSIHDLAYDDTAYHLLIQNFNKLGFGDDARECQYSYRCKHRVELFRQHKFDRWLFDLLAWATYGYGLRPVRPLSWAALFILIGGLFFFLTGSVIRPKDVPSERKTLAILRREDKPDGEVSIWEALLLAATYFTSGASSIISATPTEFVPVGPGRYVVVLLRLLGWIFFVIFLSSLTRTV